MGCLMRPKTLVTSNILAENVLDANLSLKKRKRMEINLKKNVGKPKDITKLTSQWSLDIESLELF